MSGTSVTHLTALLTETVSSSTGCFSILCGWQFNLTQFEGVSVMWYTYKLHPFHFSEFVNHRSCVCGPCFGEYVQRSHENKSIVDNRILHEQSWETHHNATQLKIIHWQSVIRKDLIPNFMLILGLIDGLLLCNWKWSDHMQSDDSWSNVQNHRVHVKPSCSTVAAGSCLISVYFIILPLNWFGWVTHLSVIY